MGESKKKEGRELVSEARRRTLHKMKTLLAAGAATGAAFTLSACATGGGDPVPPPVQCSADQTSAYYATYIVTQALLEERDGGFQAIVVSAHIDDWSDALVFSGPPEVEGGTAGNPEVSDTEARFDLTPDEGTGVVRVSYPLDCGGLADAYVVDYDLSRIDRPGGVSGQPVNE